MDQMSFGDAEYAGKRKQTRREAFLAEMDKVVPWSDLLALIEPHYPKAGRGRHPYPIATMLRIHLMQNWFGLSDPGMEEALYEITPMRHFARLRMTGAIPDETTILNFRRLLEQHDLAPRILEVVNGHLTRKGLLLKRGTIVDATIIAAPSSTKNETGQRDPEMHQTKKGNQWYFGMKAHIGVDVESGLVHTVRTTAANEADVVQVGELLHGEETIVHADAGYTGAEKRVEDRELTWHVAEKRGKVKAIKHDAMREAVQELETLKARIRAKVEHPFRVVKRQFGYLKVRFRGLAKNTAQVLTLFALSNLFQARRRLLALTGEVRLQGAG
jgi:IS5 family transposase